MFSGIISEVGRVTSARVGRGVKELTILAPGSVPALDPGSSIAVDGACLTVLETSEGSFTVQGIATTRSRTIVDGYTEGTAVNLERALAVGESLDGHLLQGHVDGQGQVLSVKQDGDSHLMSFLLPRRLWDLTIPQGSIAVNGVSLTVHELSPPDHCWVGLIPFTWERTNLSRLTPGDRVNLEADLMGKYVGKMLDPYIGAIRRENRVS